MSTKRIGQEAGISAFSARTTTELLAQMQKYILENAKQGEPGKDGESGYWTTFRESPLTINQLTSGYEFVLTLPTLEPSQNIEAIQGTFYKHIYIMPTGDTNYQGFNLIANYSVKKVDGGGGAYYRTIISGQAVPDNSALTASAGIYLLNGYHTNSNLTDGIGDIATLPFDLLDRYGNILSWTKISEDIDNPGVAQLNYKITT